MTLRPNSNLPICKYLDYEYIINQFHCSIYTVFSELSEKLVICENEPEAHRENIERLSTNGIVAN